MWSRRDVKKSLRRSQIVIAVGLQHASNVKPCLHSVYILQKFIVSCCFSQYRRICIRYNIEANSWSTKDYIQYWLHLSSTLQSSLLEWLQTEDNSKTEIKLVQVAIIPTFSVHRSYKLVSWHSVHHHGNSLAPFCQKKPFLSSSVNSDF